MKNNWIRDGNRREGTGEEIEREREQVNGRVRDRVGKEQNILTNYKLMEIGIGAGAIARA